RDLELSALAGKLVRLVVLRKLHLDGPALARRGACELLLESRYQPARSKLEQLIAPGPAIELIAVDRADVIHHDVVAVLRRSLDGLERGEALPKPLELLVDVTV